MILDRNNRNILQINKKNLNVDMEVAKAKTGSNETSWHICKYPSRYELQNLKKYWLLNALPT